MRSVGSKGDFPYDNAAAESLNSLYKRELIDLRKDWKGVDDVVIATTRRLTGGMPSRRRASSAGTNVVWATVFRAFHTHTTSANAGW